MQELSDELSDIDGVIIRISENRVKVKFGVTTLESFRYEFTNEFSVRETNRWGYPSSDITDRTHRFDTSTQVIEYFVKECAQYVASINKD